jgi:hypothetical protein
MAQPARQPWSVRLRHEDEESTAAAIHGIVVGAAVMAASHADTAGKVVAGVGVTLFVYWAAERYSRMVAQRIHADRKPTWREAGRQLTEGWEIITASALPLLVVALFSWRGSDVSTAVLAGLVCATVLLCVAGWEIGRGSQLSVLERLALIGVAGGFGGLMILFKTLLH